MHRDIRIAAVALAIALLAACSPPKPPEEERRPEPQAQGEARAQSAIVDTANAYKDAARDAVSTQESSDDDQRKQIEAATQ